MNAEGTTTAEALLGMLSLGPRSGYELRKLIGESIGNFWAESYGQIYPTLKRLEQEELVRSAEGERMGSKVYSLTDAGFARLREWLGVPPKRQVARNDLLLKLFFGNLSSLETVWGQVEARRKELVADLGRYDGIERDLQRRHAGEAGLPFWLMTVRYGKAEAKALVTWCEETLGALEEIERPTAVHADGTDQEQARA